MTQAATGGCLSFARSELFFEEIVRKLNFETKTGLQSCIFVEMAPPHQTCTRSAGKLTSLSKFMS